MSPTAPPISERRLKAVADLQKLAADGQIDNARFAGAIYAAISEWAVAESAFRDAFGLTAGAVHRWTMQQNLPQPDIRPVILRWVAEQIAQPE